MIMISQKKEDFSIYVEDDNHNYISTEFILEHESHLDKKIGLTIKFSAERGVDSGSYTLWISRENLKSLTLMLNEVVKYL